MHRTKPALDLSKGRPPRSSKGFTIVEVMMASVILVVGFMGMITCITIGSEMLATARRQTLAAQIITGEIDKLRLTAWTNLPAAGGPTSITIDSQYDTAITAAGLTSSTINLKRTVTDLDVDSVTGTDLKEVSFVIEWTKSGTTTAANNPTGSWLDRLAFYRPGAISRTYTRSMSTTLSKYGLSLAYQR